MINRIRKCFVSGDLLLGFKLLEQLDPKNIQLLIQYSKLEEENDLGILRRSEYLIERNKLISSAFKLLNIEDGDVEIVNKLNKILELSMSIDNKVKMIDLTVKSKLDLIISDIDTIESDLFITKNEMDKFFHSMKMEISDSQQISENQKMEWFDRELKDKIKITLSLFFIKWERELDVSGGKFPKTWNEFKNIFIVDKLKLIATDNSR